MAKKQMVWGPSYEEMLDPEKIDENIRKEAKIAFTEDPLNPINLYNINWYDIDDKLCYLVVPKELTGVKANIILLYGKNFPTGSHKVGATYSVIMENQLNGLISPDRDTLIFPSTGNYGIGGAWTGVTMGYDTKIILPELMSKERFEKIASYGAEYIKTTGCESSVKEIYDKCWELASENKKNKILNQFESFANYRFHYYVTGNTMSKVVQKINEKGIGNGRISAVVLSMGSSGTIASGDRVKQLYSEAKIVGLEPIKCSTIYNNGYGDHDIQGIGDKHVTWIHNVMNMDCIMCIDDIECKKGLQLLTDPKGCEYLANEAGISIETLHALSSIMGISGICNLLGAIKTAKYYDMNENENIISVCTDNIERYHSVMSELDESYGKLNISEMAVRYNSIFKNVKLDYIEEGTYKNRIRWHNLKYYTWVEQQGKTVAELDAQKSQDYWIEKQRFTYNNGSRIN